ncbi:hypothetical protein HS9_02620 [Bacillus velezensis]|nr:hypothetical protein HS9_02620 [Bacillus velezensis]
MEKKLKRVITAFSAVIENEPSREAVRLKWVFCENQCR